MKRILAVLLLLIMTSTLMSGCKSEEDIQKEKAKKLSEQIMGAGKKVEAPGKYGDFKNEKK